MSCCKLQWLDITTTNEKSVISTWYKPPTLRWLPQAKTNLFPKTSDSDTGLFTQVRNANVRNHTAFGLLELALPPFLAPKYHQMSIVKLTAGESESSIQSKKYVSNAMWYANYCDTFGIHYLHELHNKNIVYKIRLNKQVSKEEINEGVRNFLCILKSTGKCTLSENVPQLSDCAKNSKDFLQEPSIIIQLPWNTVLFHQWLVAALIEVLTFEKHTLELRHWPLPPQVEPVATQLLLLVKHLKEKIYLGFVILSHQIMLDYGRVIAKYPKWILDNVVLPSLARLQFINPSTGKGHDILRSIKKLSWAKSEPESKRVYCPFEAYNVPSVISQAFENCMYSASFWYNLYAWGPLAETGCTNCLDIEKIIQNLLDKSNIGKKRDDYRKSFTIAELLLMKKCDDKRKEENIIEFVDEEYKNTLKFIKENIFDKGHLPLDSYKTIVDMFKVAAEQKMTDKQYLESVCVLLIHICMIHKDIKQHLIEFEKETSILPHVVSLAYQVAEHDFLIRITNIIAHELKITPVDINLKNIAAPMKIPKMLKCMSEVVVRDRDWLWSQFPAQWRQPVTLTQPDINMDMPVDKIVKTCEDRIGRIIINAAQTCFDVYQKGGEIFPQWKTVQYIMPCYVAMCADTLKTREKIGMDEDQCSENYVKLIEGLLKRYELAYLIWAKSITPRQIPNTKSDCIVDIMPDTMEVFHVLDHLLEMTNFLSISHLQPNFPLDYNNYFFEPIFRPMLMWYNQLQPIEESVIEHDFLKHWLLKSLPIAQDLYNTCIKIWQYPNQTNLLAFGYEELYEMNELIMYIGKVFKRVHLYLLRCELKDIVLPFLPPYTHVLVNDLKLTEKELYEWRFKLVLTLSNPEIHENPTKSIPDILEAGKTLLHKVFNLHRPYAENLTNKIKLPSLKFLPVMNEKHKLVHDLYLKADFNTLESMMPLLFNSITEVVEVLPTLKPTKYFTVEPLKSMDDVKRNKCRNCPKKEKRAGRFLICEACVKDKYPDVNYFCSVKCKEEWWGKEHKAEHLEFELGMLNLSHTKS